MKDGPTQNTTDSGARGIGAISLAALVVANMVGAGIFVSSGYSLAMLGNPQRVLLSWSLCGLWAICGAMAYGALIRRLPQSGGEYLFLSRLVHPSIGFLAGWISLVAGFTAPIAIAAKSAVSFGYPGLEPTAAAMLASLLIATVAATLWFGIALSARTQTIVVLAKLTLLLVLIAWAYIFTSAESWLGGPLPNRSPELFPSDRSSWITLVGSMTWIALSYTGFNAAIYVAGEATNARKNVPWAMLLATIVVTALYLALNYIFVFAPAPETISGQKNVAEIAARAIGGESLSFLVRVIVTVAMISSVFSLLIAGPRVYQQMAIDGAMPGLLRGEAGNPRLAIALQSALAILTVFAGDLLEVMQYLGMTLSVSGALAIGSLFWMRHRIGSEPLRWYEIIPACSYLVFTVALLAAGYVEQRNQFYAMVGTFSVGCLVYAISRAIYPSVNGSPSAGGTPSNESQTQE